MAVPKVVYASLGGPINQDSLSRIFSNISGGIQAGAQELHLLMQSTGGFVGDGLSLYSYFQALPIDLHVYNTGTVSSIAVIAYLGAKNRYVSQHGRFMIHKSTVTLQPAQTAAQLRRFADSLEADDARTEAILKTNTNIPAQSWAAHAVGDVFFDANEAVNYGLAHAVRDFQVPPGRPLFTV